MGEDRSGRGSPRASSIVGMNGRRLKGVWKRVVSSSGRLVSSDTRRASTCRARVVINRSVISIRSSNDAKAL